ncbi:MAG: glucosaminidase domain-containing protein [Bacteroidetes bacterium]|nr:glucosaminidase domain-containing protein [Bacteroidota bacterium]
MPKGKIFVLLFTLFFLKLFSQNETEKIRSYIASHAEEAVTQMIDYKIPASVTLAQAIFESACGESDLAKRSNNHFGIKCHRQWAGDTVLKTDDEPNECFRKYKSTQESFIDHSLFLTSRAWYAPLFKLNIYDYKNWCKGLKAAGYATYPLYAEKLIAIIEEYKLYELDDYTPLNRGVKFFNKDNEIVVSKYKSADFSLQTFLQEDLLWLNEKKVSVQHLNTLVEQANAIVGEGLYK